MSPSTQIAVGGLVISVVVGGLGVLWQKWRVAEDEREVADATRRSAERREADRAQVAARAQARREAQARDVAVRQQAAEFRLAALWGHIARIDRQILHQPLLSPKRRVLRAERRRLIALIERIERRQASHGTRT